MRIRSDVPPGFAPGAHIKLGVDAPSGARYVFRASMGMVCEVAEVDAQHLLAQPGFHAVDPVEVPSAPDAGYNLHHLDRKGLLAIAARLAVKVHHRMSDDTLREKLSILLEADHADDAGTV